MNILKKSLAPITDKAWDEITEQAENAFKNFSTTRKFSDIDGPFGFDYGAVSTGRIQKNSVEEKDGVNFGIREVQPLVEIRKPFELDLWELDNINRGAKDVDLKAMEEALKDLAFFEEKAVYEGFKDAHIKGLEESSEFEKVNIFSDDANEFIKTIGAQVTRFKREGIEGPYSLIINDEKWQNLVSLAKGYPIDKQLQEVIGGKLILNHTNNNSYLVSERGGDFELTLGQDFSIGYDGHDTKTVKLFFTESFTFRVLTPEAIITLCHPN